MSYCISVFLHELTISCLLEIVHMTFKMWSVSISGTVLNRTIFYCSHGLKKTDKCHVRKKKKKSYLQHEHSLRVFGEVNIGLVF